MFTGIVEERGYVERIERVGDSARLWVHGPLVVRDTAHGASIAVSGVCLTVVTFDDARFAADLMTETLDRSCLGELLPGDPVNLERAMRADARFGGHIVQGHVDATAQVVTREPGDNCELVTVSLPVELAKYVVEKGSITVDGVSLTVAHRNLDTFTVSLIPTTLELTTLGNKVPGARVNLEVDVLAKYVESLIGTHS